MTTEIELRAYRFTDATERGEVVDEDGYHQPDSGTHTARGKRHCGCEKTTKKGAYRDVAVEMPEGITIHYYHQSPVVVTDGDRYRLDSCGYETTTTKKRINRYIPHGYSVVQRDHDWYLETPDGDREPFHDGMTIEP